MLRFTDDNRGSSIRDALLLLELMEEQKRKWKDEQDKGKKEEKKPEKFMGMEYKRLANVLFLLAPLIGIIQLCVYAVLTIGLYRFLQVIIK